MKPLPTPRRLLTLQALLARRPPRERAEPHLDTRLPDDADRAVLTLALAPRAPTRHDIERVLDEGSRRPYPPRSETEVLERH